MFNQPSFQLRQTFMEVSNTITQRLLQGLQKRIETPVKMEMYHTHASEKVNIRQKAVCDSTAKLTIYPKTRHGKQIQG
jgi:hypothetical protein